MRVLIIGSGGREHALANALSHEHNEVFIAPGNPGAAEVAQRVFIPSLSFGDLTEFASRNSIDLTVVGPEEPLSNGIVDYFCDRGLPIFGPSKAAAQAEVSKIFAKTICDQSGVPTARWGQFPDASTAISALERFGPPWVIKADGIAGGKGVVVTTSRAEAIAAIHWSLSRPPARVLIEEFIDGWEATIIATIAADYVCWVAPVYQDSKRLLNGDRGPHTGGMGPFTPVPDASSEFVTNVVEKILSPFVRRLAQNGMPYYGVMSPNVITRYGTQMPYLLEYNARFGDPEMQCLAPLISSGMAEHLLSIACNSRPKDPPKLDLSVQTAASVAITIASPGYPEAPQLGATISLTSATRPNVHVFQAGTAVNEGSLITAGGRVLTVVALAPNLNEARANAYATIESCVHFKGMHYRTDIGLLGASERRPPLPSPSYSPK